MTQPTPEQYVHDTLQMPARKFTGDYMTVSIPHVHIPNLLSTNDPILFLGHFDPADYRKTMPLLAKDATVYAPNIWRASLYPEQNEVTRGALLDAYLKDMNLDKATVVAHRSGVTDFFELRELMRRDSRFTPTRFVALDPVHISWSQYANIPVEAATNLSVWPGARELQPPIAQAPEQEPKVEHKLTFVDANHPHELYTAATLDELISAKRCDMMIGTQFGASFLSGFRKL